jgi:hypothetical protein
MIPQKKHYQIFDHFVTEFYQKNGPYHLVLTDEDVLITQNGKIQPKYSYSAVQKAHKVTHNGQILKSRFPFDNSEKISTKRKGDIS